ncbi:hypothetical protein ACFWD1_14260 [Micromonospora chalcea]
MLTAEAPKITDWMQAWSGLLGLFMSTVAVIFTGLLLRHEIRVRRNEQRDSEAAQSRLIAGRVVGFEREQIRSPTGLRKGEIIGVKWRVDNYSQAPVFDVRVVVHSEFLQMAFEADQWMSVLRDFETGEVDITGCMPRDANDNEITLDDFQLELLYTDQNGLHWWRMGAGVPRRIIVPEEPHFSKHAPSLYGDNPSSPTNTFPVLLTKVLSSARRKRHRS